MHRVAQYSLERLQRISAAVVVAAVLSSCKTDSISMRVVDAETDAPVAGAVAVYELHSATGHGTIYTQNAVYEAISDNEGWLQIPPQNVTIIVTSGLRSPNLMVFRSGYNPEFLGNSFRTSPDLKDVLHWERNGQTIRLKRPSSFQQYARQVDFFNNELRHLYDWPNDDPCGWKTIPNAVMAVEQEMIQFEANRKRQHNSTVLRDLLGNEAYSRGSNKIVTRCGSPNEFFSKYSVLCPDGSAMMTNISRRSQIDEVSHVGTSIVLFTLGYCPTDKKYWLHQQGAGWQPTSQKSLDFIQDKRHAR